MRLARSPLRSSALRGAAAALALFAAGCSGDATDIGVPLPDLDRAEPLVAERVRQAAEVVAAQRDSAQAWGRLAAVLDVNGYPHESLPCYDKALALDPGQWRWSYFAGLAMRDEDPAVARTHLERAAELQTGYPPLEYQLGYVALRAGDLDEARTRFERALAADPRSVNALIGLSHVAVKSGDAAAALELLDRAAAVAPNEAAVYLHRAEVLRKLDRPDEATAQADVARASRIPPAEDGFATLVDPVRDEVTLAEGVTRRWLLTNARRHLAAGRRAQGLETLRKAVETDPNSIDLRLEASRTLAGAGAFAEAAAEAERAVILDGSRADAYAQLGETLAWAGQTERAAEALRHALQNDSELHEARGALGMLLASTGQEDDGIAMLREASAGRPGNVDLGYNLAAALVRAGRLDEARQVAEDLTQRAPGYAPAQVLLGTIHAMSGRLDESVATLGRAVELAPNDVDARMELGRSLWELRRYGESIAAFEQAAARRPRDPEIARELAWSLATCPDAAARDAARALALAQQLCESSRYRNPMYLETLAAAQAATGNFDGAVETAGQALTLVESALAGLEGSADDAKRGVLRDFAEQLRTRRERYRASKL